MTIIRMNIEEKKKGITMTRFHFEFILFRCRKKRCGLVNSKYVVFNIRHSINKNPDMFQKN